MNDTTRTRRGRAFASSALRALMALVLCVGLLPVASADPNTAFAADDEDVYEISCEEDLVAFADVVNGYTDEDGVSHAADTDACAVLTADFELESGELPTLGASISAGFSGTVDGQGHTISGIESVEKYAFVAYLDGGTICDLALEGSLDGGYSAFVYKASSGTIEGCVNGVDISTSRQGAAGFVYQLNLDADDVLVVTGCTNEADIASSYSGSSVAPTASVGVAGILAGGVAGSKGSVTISECANTGAISGKNAAGIVGSLYTSVSGGTVSIERCCNTGSVESSGSAGAGILATCGHTTGARRTIAVEDCYNLGTVTAADTLTSAAGGFGGIVGSAGVYNSVWGLSIESCYNAGEVVYEGAADLALGAVIGLNAASEGLVTIEGAYYLAGTADDAVGSGAEECDGTAASVTAGALHVLEYALNDGEEDVWVSACAAGHPLLAWQAEADPHTFSAENVEWTWSDDYTSATATLACDLCEGSDVELDVEVSYEVVSEGDCTTGVTVNASATATLPDGLGTATDTHENVVVAATGHSWQVSAWTWADDLSSAALTLVCSVCGASVEVQAAVEASTAEATCEQDGSTTYTATASYNGVEYADEQTATLAATGHSWQVSAWTWADDLSSAALTLVCSVCGASVEVQAAVEASTTSSGVVYTAVAEYDGATFTDSAESSYTLTRIGGANRYETAALEALEAYGEEGCDTVVLATGANFPDSLAATALAGALDAPILLTKQASLPDAAAKAIGQLGATTVIVVGGESAVGADVVAALEEAGLDVVRLAGDNRYETALAIYEYGLTADGGVSVWGDALIVASGAEFADALSASSLAYSQRYPVLLVNTAGDMDEATAAAVQAADAQEAIVVGGEAAVSAQTAEQLADVLGAQATTRLGGTTRYDTSVLIAQYAVENGLLTSDNAAFASGSAFPDALAGSALQGASGSVMLLVSDTKTATVSALAEAAGDVESVRILGGVDAVSETVQAAVVDALGWEAYDYVEASEL